ncbi:MULTISPECIES: TetR/AcrR family transcriptional regulator [unclassified Modestobacter]|uniref:TetR/AcrR family transcriptional regulator n=1 Tax=unclassified Modestobacter TaxID=2643866 RepID=UPI0022AA8AC2|nr:MULTISPECIES: TetR/AcrR family transcriptional regulator [unclassified Modestobacter]MCZ2826904.1 helix-turn-helix domain containing protein [Modestobacter sp. VKM Ac-2981]MCZ2855400.1 helix-turn-helix domain containing protein [Modestobacter sp. VKM Ac-2982]
MTSSQDAPREGTGRLSLREQNRLRTRRVLLDAALQVFAERGFGGATVEAIAAEAGASKVTLYAYFPAGRDDLFRTLYEEVNEELLDRVAASHGQASGFVDKVAALARPLLEIGARPLVGRFYSNSDPSVEPALAPVRGHASRVVAKLIAEDVAEARAAGVMAAGVEPATLAALLVGASRAALVEVAEDPGRSEELLAGIVALATGLVRPDRS